MQLQSGRDQIIYSYPLIKKEDGSVLYTKLNPKEPISPLHWQTINSKKIQINLAGLDIANGTNRVV